MSFKKVFERHVNENMRESNAGRAPPVEATDAESTDADFDMKKYHSPYEPPKQAEEPDWSEKQDRPPRFSTLFGVAPPLPPRAFESYPEPKRKSGVFVPMPLLVIFAVVLVFESTLLFAYTVIGLYNNMPSRLMPGGTGCAYELTNRLPAVNIAPNFVMPQALAAQTVTVFGEGALSESLPTTASGSIILITTSASTTTSPIEASSRAAAAVASGLLGMLRSSELFTSTDATSSGGRLIMTVTASPPTSTQIFSEIAPLPSTVRSTLLLTVDAAGSTLAPIPSLTVSRTTSAAERR